MQIWCSSFRVGHSDNWIEAVIVTLSGQRRQMFLAVKVLLLYMSYISRHDVVKLLVSTSLCIDKVFVVSLHNMPAEVILLWPLCKRWLRVSRATEAAEYGCCYRG
jgi:hypothetical protein